MYRLDPQCIEYIREIPRRYQRMFKVAKECGYDDTICEALAAHEIGKDAIDAITLFLDIHDSNEDDLK